MQLWFRLEMSQFWWQSILITCRILNQQRRPFQAEGYQPVGLTFTSRKMRLPLLTVAPPADPTIFVIQRCQLLTPQSHSPSPLENLPADHRSAAKTCNSPKWWGRLFCSVWCYGANVGGCEERQFDCTDFREHAEDSSIWWILDGFAPVGLEKIYICHLFQQEVQKEINQSVWHHSVKKS